MPESNIKIVSEDTARSMGDFTEDEIQRAKSRGDGYIVTMDGVKYYLNIQYNNLETGKRNVEMPDSVGTGANRLKPGSLRFTGK